MAGDCGRHGGPSDFFPGIRHYEVVVSRGRPLAVVPASVTVRGRMSWLLRVHRLAHPDPAIRSATAFVQKLGSPPGKHLLTEVELSKLESPKPLRPLTADWLRRYETALGLAAGQLSDIQTMLMLNSGAVMAGTRSPRAETDALPSVSDSAHPLTSRQWCTLTDEVMSSRRRARRVRALAEPAVEALCAASSIDEYLMGDVVARLGPDCLPVLVEAARDPDNARSNHAAAAVGYFPQPAAWSAAARLVTTDEPLVMMRSLDAWLRLGRNGTRGLSDIHLRTSRARILELLDPASDVGFGLSERAAVVARRHFSALPVVARELQRRRSSGWVDRLEVSALTPVQHRLIGRLTGLGQILETPDPALPIYLREALYHPESSRRAEARFLLRASPYAGALTRAVVEVLPAQPAQVQQALARMLGTLGQSSAGPCLRQLLEGAASIAVKLSAAGSLCDIALAEDSDWLGPAMDRSTVPALRAGLVHVAGVHGLRNVLTLARQDAEPDVRREARYWLRTRVADRSWPSQWPCAPALR